MGVVAANRRGNAAASEKEKPPGRLGARPGRRREGRGLRVSALPPLGVVDEGVVEKRTEGAPFWARTTKPASRGWKPRCGGCMRRDERGWRVTWKLSGTKCSSR